MRYAFVVGIPPCRVIAVLRCGIDNIGQAELGPMLLIPAKMLGFRQEATGSSDWWGLPRIGNAPVTGVPRLAG